MYTNNLADVLPENADSALIISPDNRRYFTSFNSSDGFLLITKKGSIFFTDSRYIEAAEKQISRCDVCEGKNFFAQIRDYLIERNAQSIAVEAGGITVSQYLRLADRSELCGFELICDGELDKNINRIRSVKSAEEVLYIKQAQAIAEKSFLNILDFIKAGRTEKEIQLELDYYMLKNGAEALSFETIAVSGVNSSMPHGVPSEKPVNNGDFITMDFGAVVNGYHSDMTRTVALGSVSDEQEHVYNVVLAAQQAAIDAVKAGVACSDGDKAARDVISQAGYGEYFGHSTGHGVGIEIHEEPNLSPNAKGFLQKGNIVTVEPGIYLPGKFGVRIEDMVLITDEGCENLTKAEKGLVTV